MTPDQQAEMQEKIRKFLADPANVAELRERLQQSEAAAKRLIESQRVDWETLHRPMTI